jgi:acyl-lipid omega-6 desaturase (Delta-12 desaturase)
VAGPVRVTSFAASRMHLGDRAQQVASWLDEPGAEKDPSYPPLSVEQFEALPFWRRALFRSYQTLWGFGLYYVIEVWLKCQILCRRDGFTEGLRPARMVLDYFLVATYAALAVLAAFATGGWINVLAMFIVPFVVWNYLMAFVTMLHHTHPRVKWYKDRTSWSFYQAQVRGTVHIVPPLIVDVLFANIFHHTAHHVDKTIPLYNLRGAQESLSNRFSDDVIKIRLSVKHFSMVLRECQLYDFDQCSWRRFPGSRRKLDVGTPGQAGNL